MKRAICPITKQVLDCKNCHAPKNIKCPYNVGDRFVEYTLEFCRRIVEIEYQEKYGVKK